MIHSIIHAHNCGDAVFSVANHWGLFRVSNVQHGFPTAEGAWNIPPENLSFSPRFGVGMNKAISLKVSHFEKVQALSQPRPESGR